MKVILFRGRPGAGKTTISNLLSKELNIPVLRKDDIYDTASEFVEDHQIKNKISYNSVYAILETNKETDCAFILDYPFQTFAEVSIIKDWCKERNIDLKSILVTCSDESLWAERFSVRANNPKPNQLITNFEEMRKHYGVMQLSPEEGELVIDTAKSEEIVVAEVKVFIN